MEFKIVIFVFFSVLVFSIGLASALSNSTGEDWEYYRVITIKENSGNTLNDYQIFVELNKMDFPTEAKPDGSDIRFTKGTKELDMYIEEFDINKKTGKIWVKIPNILANEELKIRMYYGNNEKAGSISNKDAVMEFHDDFNDATYTDKWEVAEGNWTQSKGTIIQTDNAKKALYAKDVAITDNIIIESKLRGHQIGVATRLNDSSNCWFYHIDSKYKNSVCVSLISDGNLLQTKYAPILNMDNQKWYIIRGTTLGPTVKAELFDSKWNFLTPATGYFNNETGNRVGLISIQGGEFDWFRVRKYTSPEPSVSVSEEFVIQEIPSLTLTKSTSSSIIHEGENIIISNMVENTGYKDAKNIEIVDTVPTGFELISGSRSLFLEKIEPGGDQNFEYSIKATETGKFIVSPSTLIYKDDRDTVFFNESNPITIQVDIATPLKTQNITNETLLDNISIDSSMEKKTSGFGTLLFIVGLLSAVYLLNRRPPSL